jgi:hypothetical protein
MRAVQVCISCILPGILAGDQFGHTRCGSQILFADLCCEIIFMPDIADFIDYRLIVRTAESFSNTYRAELIAALQSVLFRYLAAQVIN